MAKQIRYSEPTGYFPKSVLDQFKKNAKKPTAKKTTPKKSK